MPLFFTAIKRVLGTLGYEYPDEELGATTTTTSPTPTVTAREAQDPAGGEAESASINGGAPSLILYPQWAKQLDSSEATTYAIHLHGVALYRSTVDPTWLERGIEGLFDAYYHENDPVEINELHDRLSWFFGACCTSRPIESVRLYIPGEREPRMMDLPPGSATDEEGHFHLVFLTEITSSLPPNMHFKYDVTLAPDVATGKPGVTATGRIQVVRHSGFSIVSDVDDTVKDTRVLDQKEVIKRAFIKPYTAIPGMPDLFRGLVEQYSEGLEDFHLHFLSASPYAILPSLDNFFLTSGFPSPSVQVANFSFRHLASLHPDLKIYKRNGTMDVISQFPGRKFLLFGDSGQMDAEAYGEVVRDMQGGEGKDWPDERIVGIFIRKVTGENVPLESKLNAPSRFQAAFIGLNSRKWRVFSDPIELIGLDLTSGQVWREDEVNTFATANVIPDGPKEQKETEDAANDLLDDAHHVAAVGEALMGQDIATKMAAGIAGTAAAAEMTHGKMRSIGGSEDEKDEDDGEIVQLPSPTLTTPTADGFTLLHSHSISQDETVLQENATREVPPEESLLSQETEVVQGKEEEEVQALITPEPLQEASKERETMITSAMEEPFPSADEQAVEEAAIVVEDRNIQEKPCQEEPLEEDISASAREMEKEDKKEADVAESIEPGLEVAVHDDGIEKTTQKEVPTEIIYQGEEEVTSQDVHEEERKELEESVSAEMTIEGSSEKMEESKPMEEIATTETDVEQSREVLMDTMIERTIQEESARSEAFWEGSLGHEPPVAHDRQSDAVCLEEQAKLESVEDSDAFNTEAATKEDVEETSEKPTLTVTELPTTDSSLSGFAPETIRQNDSTDDTFSQAHSPSMEREMVSDTVDNTTTTVEEPSEDISISQAAFTTADPLEAEVSTKQEEPNADELYPVAVEQEGDLEMLDSEDQYQQPSTIKEEGAQVKELTAEVENVSPPIQDAVNDRKPEVPAIETQVDLSTEEPLTEPISKVEENNVPDIMTKEGDKEADDNLTRESKVEEVYDTAEGDAKAELAQEISESDESAQQNSASKTADNLVEDLMVESDVMAAEGTFHEDSVESPHEEIALSEHEDISVADSPHQTPNVVVADMEDKEAEKMERHTETIISTEEPSIPSPETICISQGSNEEKPEEEIKTEKEEVNVEEDESKTAIEAKAEEEGPKVEEERVKDEKEEIKGEEEEIKGEEEEIKGEEEEAKAEEVETKAKEEEDKIEEEEAKIVEEEVKAEEKEFKTEKEESQTEEEVETTEKEVKTEEGETKVEETKVEQNEVKLEVEEAEVEETRTEEVEVKEAEGGQDEVTEKATEEAVERPLNQDDDVQKEVVEEEYLMGNEDHTHETESLSEAVSINEVKTSDAEDADVKEESISMETSESPVTTDAEMAENVVEPSSLW
ncbi:hypothetical protein BJ684DRAFT_20458 [Piptocephalis cylindrospora]|uniref:Phosphatidate phosphatase APP1 catalytic domain-containing protein n=1 Tax=Piptocephalis cylindrospora TaxID=1907219 RepID=A0A4P9Y2C8_9FUNG|nr:hypothetical protein BJ684DRAFT_20458 [Piptocephalis cylindrospora]|eukprot:RKP13028.1 hypothetical protein BJ684DRAFT_20458 [Piptocephalis cylindrospora]